MAAYSDAKPPKGEGPLAQSRAGEAVLKRHERPHGAATAAGAERRAVRQKACAAPHGTEPPTQPGVGSGECSTTPPSPLRGVGDSLSGPFWGSLEEEPAARLRSAGVTDARDLACLTIAGLARILGTQPSEAVLRLRRSGEDEIQAELDAPLEGGIRPLFPTSAPQTQTPPAAAPLRAASVRGAGPADWRPARLGSTPTAEDDARRTTAATAAVRVLRRHEASSTHAAEIVAARAAGRAEEWYGALVNVLARRYEAQGMMHPVRVWRRWLRWRGEQQVSLTDDPAAPLALNLATWLADEASKGHTVQQSMLDGLKWLAAHLGMKGLPLQSPLLEGMATMGWKVERQAAELPLEVWAHFLHLATQAPGAIALIAKLMLYVTVATLRFRHAQRHRFLHDRCDEDMLVGEVARGKIRRRAAFLVANPTHVGEGVPLFRELYDELRAKAPDACYLVPDLEDHKGTGIAAGTPVLQKPMSYSKFMGVLRALTMAPPLAFTAEQARKLTSYSLRRKLPSVADRAGFPQERRAQLGDWRDPIGGGLGAARQGHEPMAVRYSAARLASSVRARLACLVVMNGALKAGPQQEGSARILKEPWCTPEALEKTWRQHEAVARNGAWGFPRCSEQQEAEQEQEGTKDADKMLDDTTSNSTASHSADDTADSSDDEGDDEKKNREDEVPWVLPEGYRTRVHASGGVRAADGRLIPLCRQEPFSWAAEEGVGLQAATATGRKMHAACWTKCGIRLDD